MPCILYNGIVWGAGYIVLVRAGSSLYVCILGLNSCSVINDHSNMCLCDISWWFVHAGITSPLMTISPGPLTPISMRDCKYFLEISPLYLYSSHLQLCTWHNSIYIVTSCYTILIFSMHTHTVELVFSLQLSKIQLLTSAPLLTSLLGWPSTLLNLAAPSKIAHTSWSSVHEVLWTTLKPRLVPSITWMSVGNVATLSRHTRPLSMISFLTDWLLRRMSAFTSSGQALTHTTMVPPVEMDRQEMLGRALEVRISLSLSMYNCTYLLRVLIKIVLQCFVCSFYYNCLKRKFCLTSMCSHSSYLFSNTYCTFLHNLWSSRKV